MIGWQTGGMAERDRDEEGRARNARPRDALGRPLPYGTDGIQTMPDDLGLGPDESLALAQKLLDQDRPFHAHEVLEGAWKAAPEPERELWKGMAQLAVGITHVRRGNAKGAVSLLSRAIERISAYDGLPYRIDGTGLMMFGRELIVRVEREGVGRVSADDLRPKLTVLT
ncbi:DUF309 domain-containing protein [Fodinicola feengrottensis]|uniref:DUF309 domain-containing protein n=2 Tax=Fodinicola feengrottensis TaxID=435914 RepID=A0ABN2INY3_9ACTN